jgi:hypothetical protein
MSEAITLGKLISEWCDEQEFYCASYRSQDDASEHATLNGFGWNIRIDGEKLAFNDEFVNMADPKSLDILKEKITQIQGDILGPILDNTDEYL